MRVTHGLRGSSRVSRGGPIEIFFFLLIITMYSTASNNYYKRALSVIGALRRPKTFAPEANWSGKLGRYYALGAGPDKRQTCMDCWADHLFVVLFRMRAQREN